MTITDTQIREALAGLVAIKVEVQFMNAAGGTGSGFIPTAPRKPAVTGPGDKPRAVEHQVHSGARR